MPIRILIRFPNCSIADFVRNILAPGVIPSLWVVVNKFWICWIDFVEWVPSKASGWIPSCRFLIEGQSDSKRWAGISDKGFNTTDGQLKYIPVSNLIDEFEGLVSIKLIFDEGKTSGITVRTAFLAAVSYCPMHSLRCWKPGFMINFDRILSYRNGRW